MLTMKQRMDSGSEDRENGLPPGERGTTELRCGQHSGGKCNSRSF